MPSATQDCRELLIERDECYAHDHRPEAAWEEIIAKEFHEAHSDVWSERVKRQYESAQRLVRVFRWLHRSRTHTSTLERQFYEHAERWKTETQHWSSLAKIIAHPSYLRIIGLANRSTHREIVRLLLIELQNEPDHWFEALTAITGQNPVQQEQDFDEAVSAWVTWGREEGLI